MLGASWDGRRRARRGHRRPATVLRGGRGAPVREQGRGGVGELPGGEVKPAARLIWFGVGRRRGFRGSRGGGYGPQ